LAAKRLRVGAAHVNETSSPPADMVPCGGSGDSGFGRDGLAHAIHEMTDARVVSFTP